MPIIELSLPGVPRKVTLDIADYKITVERLDGVACEESEARAAMSAYVMQRALGKRLNKNPRKPKTQPAKPTYQGEMELP